MEHHALQSTEGRRYAEMGRLPATIGIATGARSATRTRHRCSPPSRVARAAQDAKRSVSTRHARPVAGERVVA
jgi:hypothetical protein